VSIPERNPQKKKNINFGKNGKIKLKNGKYNQRRFCLFVCFFSLILDYGHLNSVKDTKETELLRHVQLQVTSAQTRFRFNFVDD